MGEYNEGKKRNTAVSEAGRHGGCIDGRYGGGKSRIRSRQSRWCLKMSVLSAEGEMGWIQIQGQPEKSF